MDTKLKEMTASQMQKAAQKAATGIELRVANATYTNGPFAEPPLTPEEAGAGVSARRADSSIHERLVTTLVDLYSRQYVITRG